MSGRGSTRVACGLCGREVATGSLHDYIVAQGNVLKVCAKCWGRLLASSRPVGKRRER